MALFQRVSRSSSALPTKLSWFLKSSLRLYVPFAQTGRMPPLKLCAAQPRVSASGRRKARIAHRSDCIALRKKSAAAGRWGPFLRAANPSATPGGGCRMQKSPRESCGWKALNPASIAAAMWIRTRATSTSTARAMRRRLAVRRRAVAFILPPMTWFRSSTNCLLARWFGFLNRSSVGRGYRRAERFWSAPTCRRFGKR